MSKKFHVPIEMTKKYVRENEIYATEDGEIIRITPDKIKVIIREGKLTEVYFAEVDNEDVYSEYMRSVWRANKELQRGKKCWISNGKGKLVRCEKNCADCEHRNNTTLQDVNYIKHLVSRQHIKIGSPECVNMVFQKALTFAHF